MVRKPVAMAAADCDGLLEPQLVFWISA